MGTHWKHLIPTPSGQVQVLRRSDGTSETLYMTTDHLGSTDAVLGANGAPLLQASFGVLGARRGANWQGVPSQPEWDAVASTTRIGYTGHEQLDNVMLVHMNGRVFDPKIGRFLSADPYIDGADTTQGWNRYAYVHGRTLSATDPSGFALEEIITEAQRIARQTARAANFNIVLTGGSAGVEAPDTELPLDDTTGLEELLVKAARIWPGGGNSLPVTPQSQGCSVASSSAKAYANALPSRLLGPVSFDPPSEMALLEQYFRGDPTPYRLSGAEMVQARSYVDTYGRNVLGSAVTTRSDGLTERSVFFGRISSDAPLLDGLLGTATGVFSGSNLVGIRDTFNFDFKDRGGYPYGTMANVGVALVRLDAATCAGDVRIPVTGGTQ